jgi:putative membrane protein
LVVTGIAWVPLASAQQAPAQRAAVETRGRDEEIVMELHHDHQNQVMMARMAEQRAVSPAVRDLAARVIRDHDAADQRLVAYARVMKVDADRLEHPYDAETHGALRHPNLAQLSGREFDAQFVAATIADYQADIDRARDAQMMTDNQRLKTLIGEELPTMEAHLAAAQALAPRTAIPPEAERRPPPPQL